MKSLPGSYYDGRSSARTAVTVAISGDRLVLTGSGIEKIYLLRETDISSAIGAIRRTLRFPDGSQCEIAGDFPLDSVMAEQGTAKLAGFIHRWEKSLPLVFLALFLTIALVTCLVKYGIPAAAKRVAFSLPADTEAALGRKTMEMLDRLVFSPSKLPDERKRGVSARFQDVVSDLPGRKIMRLEFRASEKIGANAFALPSGIIVITDGLVNLARNDEEIAGVLAHEAGHLLNRHALRHVLQNSGTALVIALITGDITSVSSFSAGLPTALIEAKYSRDFEIEADDAAVAFLHRRGIPVHFYADMLRRLEEEHDKKGGTGEKGEKAGKGEKSSVADFLSSHPVTRERIERIMKGG